jgi:ribosomal protein L13E
MVIPGMTIASALAMGIAKEIIKRVAKPEKIVDILVKWLTEYAEKDKTIDWKDKLSDLLSK